MHNTAWHDKPLYSSCRKSCMTPSSMTNLCWCVNGDQAVFLWCGDTLYIYSVYMRRAPVGWLPSAVLICMVWVWQSPPVGVGFVSSVVRRCATLPHPVGCSTIAVPGLSFRVRNGSGRLPWAMAAASLQLSTRVGWLCGCLGTGGWTRRVCVFVTVDQVCGRSG